MYVMQNGMFERLLDIADSAEVFMWLAEEPEDVIEYANAMADYKIALVDKIIDNWVPIDFFAMSDDWGTQRAPFMSPKMYEQYFFGPTKRIADHIHARGYRINMHSCGKIDAIVPYIAQFSDMWEGQPMNDHVALKKALGDNLAFTINLDPKIVDDPNVTDDALVKCIRDAIDTYGEGGGMVMFTMGNSPRVTEIIMRETFEYSRKKYA
jgi:uroporphyrinogen-III decarboxylase